MTFLFLGIGAAEGDLSADCGCRSRARARAAGPGSPDRRTRASLRVGERAQIDFGLDGYSHQPQRGASLREREHLLVTHSYADHFELGRS